MRSLLILAAATAALATSIPNVQAAEWPWCAVMIDKGGLVTNCGFANIPQCQATLSGMSGWCEPNPFYRAEAPRRRSRQDRRNR